jgi:hypothetical protein
MIAWVKQLDRLLRGDVTRVSALQGGRVDVPVDGLIVLIIVLGIIYGICMGVFALTGSGSGEAMQIVASMLKVPALFLLTLIVTFPSLYVFNALVGSRLGFRAVLELLIAALAVMLAVLASLGPIVAFFSISTTSYPFMILLNVVVFAAAGLLGLSFLLQTLHRLTVIAAGPPALPTPQHQAQPIPPPEGQPDQVPPAEPAPHEPAPPSPAALPTPERSSFPAAGPAGALDRLEGHVLGRHVRTIFRIWIIVFGLVGAQMGWILRPFIGHPDLDFTWFRPREGNFFEAVFEAVGRILGA